MPVLKYRKPVASNTIGHNTIQFIDNDRIPIFALMHDIAACSCSEEGI